MIKDQPVNNIKWIPLSKVRANDYNPNTVAKNELKLLYISIKKDGYTQPCVVSYDEASDTYIMIDGFHRYLTMRSNKDIYDMCEGHLPCVVLKKNLDERMESTIRHNRARGKHTVDGMSNLVFKLLKEGESDTQICTNLGMEYDELIRLKHITGFSKLFEGVEYNKTYVLKSNQDFREKITDTDENKND